jgi:acetyl/propionyl-CoA carboxylase alpha subunit
MLKVKINGKTEHIVELEPSGNKGTINNEAFAIDLIKDGERRFHIIKDNKSYNAEIVRKEGKTMTIKVNGTKYEIEARDRHDELLKQLGLEVVGTGKVNEIKAPMPGLVLEIMVSPGQEVKKGDPIMVLEAMKMENILKSPGDGIVKSVNVEKRLAVEKNQVLISFE